MGKVRDVSKEQYWRKVIRRQIKSGEKVARFCAREGVPAHQFYWWQRTLRSRDRPLTPDPQRAADGDELARGEEEEADKAFIPVRLPFLTDAPIEVVRPAGYVVRVPLGFDSQSLRRILATLDPASSDLGEN
jgi:hypothetical protein